MNGFYGRRHGFSVRLRPVKIAGEPLKKLLDLLARDGLVLLVLQLARFLGRTWMVFGHGNLIADIVGEFVR